MVGRIVFSKAGRDKNHLMVVVSADDKFLYLCDGKERPLEKPKRKNVKHTAFTNTILDGNSYKTDKALRRELARLRDEGLKGRNQSV